MTYNLTTLESYCYTPHFTSSCSLNYTSLEEEATWRAACTAEGGVIYEITLSRYRCEEGTTDFVRLFNFVGHAECVPPTALCTTKELEEHVNLLVANEAALFGSLFNQAECVLELGKYNPAAAMGVLRMTTLAMIIVSSALVAVMWW